MAKFGIKAGIIFIIIIGQSCSLFCQKKTIDISEAKIGELRCKHRKTFDVDKGDTLRFIFIGFQNAEYSSITDIHSIIFDTNEDSLDVLQFISDLKNAVTELQNKSNMDWNRKIYSLSINKTIPSISLSKTNDRGYCWIHKNQAIKLIAWLTAIPL